jgi:hypothetical protein
MARAQACTASKIEHPAAGWKSAGSAAVFEECLSALDHIIVAEIHVVNMLQERAALTSAGTDSGSDTDPDETPETLRTVTRPLPRVLVVHTGGTLGMDPGQSYHIDASGKPVLAAGTGGKYSGGLRPGD